jgi:hypothetical protein
MHKELMLVLMQFKLMQDGDIMVKAYIFIIKVNEQSLMINNNNVDHQIILIVSIELGPNV